MTKGSLDDQKRLVSMKWAPHIMSEPGQHRIIPGVPFYAQERVPCNLAVPL